MLKITYALHRAARIAAGIADGRDRCTAEITNEDLAQLSAAERAVLGQYVAKGETITCHPQPDDGTAGALAAIRAVARDRAEKKADEIAKIVAQLDRDETVWQWAGRMDSNRTHKDDPAVVSALSRARERALERWRAAVAADPLVLLDRVAWSPYLSVDDEERAQANRRCDEALAGAPWEVVQDSGETATRHPEAGISIGTHRHWPLPAGGPSASRLEALRQERREEREAMERKQEARERENEALLVAILERDAPEMLPRYRDHLLPRDELRSVLLDLLRPYAADMPQLEGACWEPPDDDEPIVLTADQYAQLTAVRERCGAPISLPGGNEARVGVRLGSIKPEYGYEEDPEYRYEEDREVPEAVPGVRLGATIAGIWVECLRLL